MSTGDAADGGGASTEAGPRPDVRLVAGRLSDEELAAVAVALSALSVASRAEASERALAEGQGPGGGDGWTDAVHRLPGTHAARVLAADGAWQFSHR
ncbi:acyl-CoA carboxylase epsilon subunit [Brachybacterium sp. AOP25-B2-12]|uniref:acyl-CoA carboxylase epsilon subunit n=1 Tax=Brachybacterium sp. AOP25-B2-12 TaxID=3457710 RepID=UPI004034718A